MLDHLEIHTQCLADCVDFYRNALAPLGYILAVDGAQKGFKHDGQLDFWLVEGNPSKDVHFAFGAPSRSAVVEAFELSTFGGGRQDRPPALAPHIHANYFAGYARDPEGRLVEFVCQVADPDFQNE